MGAFESILLLLFAAVLLAAVARRIGAPYPAFLAVGGAVLAFLPHRPTIGIDPELALALFVAPVLLDAAYDASPRDLKDNWVPLTALVVGAVGVTTLAVAWVTVLLVPAVPWSVAVVLGAVVQPPDARPQPLFPALRLRTGSDDLGGESLLNDATALRLSGAVGAVRPGTSMPPPGAVLSSLHRRQRHLGRCGVALLRSPVEGKTPTSGSFSSSARRVWILAEHLGPRGFDDGVLRVAICQAGAAWSPRRCAASYRLG